MRYLFENPSIAFPCLTYYDDAAFLPGKERWKHLGCDR